MMKYRMVFTYLVIVLLIIILIYYYFGENIFDTSKNDNDGEEDNQIPIIIFEKQRITEPVDKEVKFNITAYDPDGWITFYEWDFNGDGIFDWNSTENGNTTFVYHNSGRYTANFKVVDNGGLSESIYLYVIIFEMMPSAPPELYIISPFNNQTVNDTINITGTARIYHSADETINVEIIVEISNYTFRREFFANTNTLDTREYDWNLLFDTTEYTKGLYKLKVNLRTNEFLDVIEEIQIEIAN